MYRLTNLTLDTTTTYKNKDLVYQALERENAKVKHQEAEGILLVEELDKKGVVIYQEDIYLPFDGIADSLFLKAGTDIPSEGPSKVRRFSFLKPSKKSLDQESSQTEKEELRDPLSDTTSQVKRGQNRFSILKVLWQGFLLIGFLSSLAIAGFAATLVLKQGEELSSLNQQVKQLETLQSETGSLDVFVRYFLSHYYSEQASLDDFVVSSLKLSNQTGQIQSVILESSSQSSNKTYLMTYVLSIKDGESSRQNRLTLTVRKVSSSLYGYQVTTEPKLENYPN